VGFLCRHCGNTFERLEHMEMHSERCWKANKADTFCNCLMMRRVECNCFEKYSELNKMLLKEKEIKEAERLKQEKFDKMKEECGCTLCFCYRTKKHIDLCDMEVIIDDVKMGNPVSECLERLYRDEVNQDFYKCYGPTEKDDNCKKPLHPGKVSNDLLRLDDDNTLIDGSLVFSNILIDLDLCESRDGERFIKRFFDGLEDVDHILAYKLAKAIEGTDVRFWMDLQERYDEYMRKNK
jgi:hypothetical protein